MSEDQDPARGPAKPGAVAGAEQQGPPPPLLPGTPPDESPETGDPAGPRPGNRRPPGLKGWAVVAGAVAVAACAVTGLGVASGAVPFNAVLLLIVAGAAIAVLVTFVRGVRPPGGPAKGGAPALIRLPAGPRARWFRIAGIVSIVVVGAIMGILSLFAGLASDACPPPGEAGIHCDNVIQAGWLVLMATQLLIFLAAVLLAGFARSSGQLALAVMLGLTGPFLALAAFGAATGTAIPNYDHDTTAVGNDVAAFQRDPGVISADLRVLASDVSQTGTDLAATRTDAAHARGPRCASVMPIVIYDATSTVYYDQQNGLTDLTTLTIDIRTARHDISAAQKDLRILIGKDGQYAPPGADAAIAGARQSIRRAIATANAGIDHINADVDAAYAAASRVATGACAGMGPGSPPSPIQHIS